MRDWIDVVERLNEGQRDWLYLANCVSLDGDLISQMVEDAEEISYAAFIKTVGEQQLVDAFPDYAWGRAKGLKMRNDPYVNYYKSTYNDSPCYYVRQSAIEYVFVRSSDYYDLMGH